jgi:plastocyanin
MRRAPPVRPLAVLALLLAVGAAPARADDPREIPVAIEKNRFQPEEIRVKAGQPFVLVVTNKDATPEEFEIREIRVEQAIPGGKTARIRVRALKPGTYPFVGEYHQATAKGRIVAE